MRDYCATNNIGYANAAHYGFGPLEYLTTLKKYVDDYQPELVIVFYNVHNDLTDAMFGLELGSKEREHDLYVTEKKSTIDSVETSSLIEQSVDTDSKIEVKPRGNSDNFDWHGFEEHGIDPEIIQYAKNRLEHPDGKGYQYVNPHILVMAKWKPDYHDLNLMLSDEQSRFAWYSTIQVFEEMIDICIKTRSKLAIVAIPSTLQLDTSHFDFYRKLKMNLSNEWMITDKPQHLIDTFSKASNVIFIDLLPDFRSLRHTESLYYQNDDHLNNLGHTAAYRLIEEELLTPFKEKSLGSKGNAKSTEFYRNYHPWKREYYLSLYRYRWGI